MAELTGKHADDTAYDALVEADADSRWAFGTGFDDPLEGVDTTVPPGMDHAALAAQCLALGDDALVLAQRLQQWCARAPELEEEHLERLSSADLEKLWRQRRRS